MYLNFELHSHYPPHGETAHPSCGQAAASTPEVRCDHQGNQACFCDDMISDLCGRIVRSSYYYYTNGMDCECRSRTRGGRNGVWLSPATLCARPCGQRRSLRLCASDCQVYDCMDRRSSCATIFFVKRLVRCAFAAFQCALSGCITFDIWTCAVTSFIAFQRYGHCQRLRVSTYETTHLPPYQRSCQPCPAFDLCASRATQSIIFHHPSCRS